ncbi:MAG: bifunctional YncE family protein/alkaline phosphatase family protein [Chthoniobacteraceae bacterium]
MPRILMTLLATSLVALAETPRTTATPGARTRVEVPGPQPDGAVLLPNQWSLRPAGKQTLVGDFPVNIALHPEGKFAAILHCGYGQHEIQILDIASGKVASRVNINEAFYGIAFSPDGSRLFCSGSSDEVLHVFNFKGAYLGEPASVPLRDKTKRGIPCGFAVSTDGATIYVANVWGQSVSRVRFAAGAATADVEELALAAPGKMAPPKATTDDPSITKRAEAILDTTGSDAPFPYACVLDEKRSRLYVSLWALAQVAVIDLKEWKEIARWNAEEHPNEMVLSKDAGHLFVANANRNSVSVFDVESGKSIETLVAELMPSAPPGNTPNSLALSADGERLFVANANINCVAVFEVEKPGHSRSLGFIPTGWYPTSVREAKGGKLLVANGKGVVSRSNRNFTQPGNKSTPTGVTEYIGGILQGTISVIPLPSEEEKFATELKKWSAVALSCMPASERTIDAAVLKGNPIPRKVGDPSPIQHVIYIIKENRTFDQVLGDLGRGNGDPSLCLFGEDITPNHHALAREFVTLDNFYVESEVSADGHEWSMGAYATDFVEKNWPLSYGHGGSKKFPYPSEGVFAIATPAGGYLWDRAAAAGVSYRSYGEFTTSPTAKEPGKAKVKALEGHFDPQFHTFDMDYPDVKRAARFVSEFERFEKEGGMPRLQIVRLPNDHTSGASPGKPTPVAHVADNDLALGMIVEAVSKSKLWATTAIFVVEDDAQNGPDHVDAHRTIAYVISPYARRGIVDSTLYSTASMLRTMELILGLQPMSQFDALAMPMFACFQPQPDLRPYERRMPKADLNEITKKTAWGVKETGTMDFSKEDAADDLLLNEVIWRNIRGADSPMPVPIRRAWVLAEDEE